MKEEMKLDLTKNLKSYEFKSKNAYIEFLQPIFKSLTDAGDYVIYMHQVTDHRTYWGETKDEKIKGIKISGLELNDYPTIHGTAFFKGTPQKLDIENDIVDYKFLCDDEILTSFVFVLPKYITVNGQRVELATFDGRGVEVLDDKDSHLYKAFVNRPTKFASVPKDPITKTCLLDTMDYRSLPNCFCLSMQSISSKGDSYVFEYNPDHFFFNQRKSRNKF